MALFGTTSTKGNSPAQRVVAPDLSIGDLSERLALTTPDDTCKGMFFNGLLAAAQVLLGIDAQLQVQASMAEKKYVDFFNYPISTFLPAAFLAAKLLQPTSPDFEGALRRMGEQATNDFLGTPVGRTLVTMSAGEPKRLMRAAPVAYKTAVSYGTRETVVLSDTACIFKMRRDFMPHTYHEGVFLAVLHALGAQNVSVRGQRLSTLDSDCFISWT